MSDVKYQKHWDVYCPECGECSQYDGFEIITSERNDGEVVEETLSHYSCAECDLTWAISDQ